LEFGKAFKYASKFELGKKPRLLMSALDLAATKGVPKAEGSLFCYKYPQTPLS